MGLIRKNKCTFDELHNYFAEKDDNLSLYILFKERKVFEDYITY
jgi:hypothetical protein